MSLKIKSIRTLRILAITCLALFRRINSYAQNIGIGPDSSSGYYGMVKFIDWYNSTSTGGCVPGPGGACVSHAPQGDTYYWSGWLPNASGLPVPSGLPVVGGINDWTLSPCGGNIGLVQMDTFDWSNPTASHMTLVNCMPTYGINGADTNVPSGWKGKLTSSRANVDGTWKSRTPFSKGGVLYFPVERQISAGTPARHDATMLISPDSGKHWCNPNTYFNHAGSPGCDSTNWKADGDAPRCDAADSASPCTNAAYLDPVHSSMMWKDMPSTIYQWLWINYGNQDGSPYPSGINDGCDPAAYTCFMGADGTLARVPNASIMDISAWAYYTCPAITHNTRCPGSDPASWTPSFANRTPVVLPSRSVFQENAMVYVKEFGSYLLTIDPMVGGQGFMTSPTVQGPWMEVFNTKATPMKNSFFAPSPALGYNVLSVNPPHVQMTCNANSYDGGEGSPHIALWDLVPGIQYPPGAPHPSEDLYAYVSGAGYQFDDLQMPGSFPLNGMEWSFDFLDQGKNSGATNMPYFVDRGRNSAVIKACNGGTYASPTLCGVMNLSRGTSMNDYGIQTNNPGYNGHFRTFPSEFSGDSEVQNAPAAMQGNGSYSVIGVYHYEGQTNFRPGGIWSTGTNGATLVELNQSFGNLQLDWGQNYIPHYQYVSNFTFPSTTGWYFIAVTVKAQTGTCGANCIPSANIWVGGAVTPGVLTDVIAGVPLTPVFGTPSAKTPNVSPGPLVLGMNGTGDASLMTTATTLVYSRALSLVEVQQMYLSMKTKMAERGVILEAAADTTAPTITAGFPQASPTTVSGTSTQLTVQATDPDDSPSGLNYHWAAVNPSSPVDFSVNDSNSASAITATFHGAGTYSFQVSARDAAGNPSPAASVMVTVTQTLSSVKITPVSATVQTDKTFPFSVNALDQFGQTVFVAGPFTWSVSGGGTINPVTGLFTAGSLIGGPFTVTVQLGSFSGTAQVTVSTFTSTGGLPPADPVLTELNNHTFTIADSLTFHYSGLTTGFNWLFAPLPARTPIPQTANASGFGSPIPTKASQLSLAAVGLGLGRYEVQIQAVNGSQVSNWVAATINVVGTSLSHVQVYPNPWKSDKHAGHNITFDGLTTDTTIKLFTTAGHKVKEMEAASSRVDWDMTNDSGEKVASGVYLYLITDKTGDKIRGKIGVIR